MWKKVLWPEQPKLNFIAYKQNLAWQKTLLTTMNTIPIVKDGNGNVMLLFSKDRRSCESVMIWPIQILDLNIHEDSST